MPTIAVTGGKGGTGKSTVAVNLAFALAKQGYGVDLLDLDIECPNDSRLSGIQVNPVSSVYKSVPVINDKCTGCGVCVQACEPKALYMLNEKVNLIEDICTGCMLCQKVCPFNAIDTGQKKVGTVSVGEVRVGSGKVTLIEGRLEVGEDESTKIIAEALKYSNSKVKIIDTAAGTHCTVVKALKKADHAFIVTEPTPFGISDSMKVVELVKKLGVGYDLVLNRDMGNDVSLPVKPKFRIPYSRALVNSYISGRPIVLQDSPEARVFGEMAEHARSILLGD